MRKGNHKFQNTKSQINSKFQKSKRLDFVPWNLEFICHLEFAVWNLHTESTSTTSRRKRRRKRLSKDNGSVLEGEYLALQMIPDCAR
jgi:hypothetical protein